MRAVSLIFLATGASLLVIIPNLLAETLKEGESQCRSDGAICMNYGVCEHQVVDGNDIDLCKCQRYYSGDDCSYLNTDCSTVSCKNGAVCETSGCVCQQPELQTGPDCGEIHCVVNGEVSSHFCKNGGKCFNGECICPNNTKGPYCENIICGEYVCSHGFCNLDKCDCEVSCELGCDNVRGECKTVPDTDESGMTQKTKIVIIGVIILGVIVIVPTLYTMYNMSVQHRLRDERFKLQLEMEGKINHKLKDKKPKKKRRSSRERDNDLYKHGIDTKKSTRKASVGAIESFPRDDTIGKTTSRKASNSTTEPISKINRKDSKKSGESQVPKMQIKEAIKNPMTYENNQTLDKALPSDHVSSRMMEEISSAKKRNSRSTNDIIKVIKATSSYETDYVMMNKQKRAKRSNSRVTSMQGSLNGSIDRTNDRPIQRKPDTTVRENDSALPSLSESIPIGGESSKQSKDKKKKKPKRGKSRLRPDKKSVNEVL